MTARFDTAAILAGGRSERMLGLDKQTLEAAGERLVYRQIRTLALFFREILVVTFRPELYTGLDVRTVSDLIPGFGPLSGLHAALTFSGSEWVFLMACDMPGFDPAFMRFCRDRIMAAERNCPVGQDCRSYPVLACNAAFREHFEPFHAFYSRRLLPSIEELCEANVRDNSRENARDEGKHSEIPARTRRVSIGTMLSHSKRVLVPEEEARQFSPDWNLFRNINSPVDLESFLTSSDTPTCGT